MLRDFQIESLRHLVDGFHLIANVLMGAGKTTIIPAYALLLKQLATHKTLGITLVVIPVISLADQHVRTLRGQGLTAARVGDPNDKHALQKILDGEVNFGLFANRTRHRVLVCDIQASAPPCGV